MKIISTISHICLLTLSHLHYCSKTITEELQITLTIIESMVEDQGIYTVKVTNEFGSVQCDAEITILYESPSFTQPLTDLTTTLDRDVTLQVKVKGQPEPTTEWYFSGSVVAESNKYHIERVLETITLTIRDVKITDTQAEYTCRAVNPIGEASTAGKLVPQGLLVVFVFCMSAVTAWQMMHIAWVHLYYKSVHLSQRLCIESLMLRSIGSNSFTTGA